ncbi:uncharacterized protein DEA37_0007231, partial [Paragonimus westermani]
SVTAALVTDKGTHFIAKSSAEWIRGLECQHLFTAARHPQFCEIAESFVCMLKSAIDSLTPNSYVEIDQGTEDPLMQCKNASHSVNGKSPAILFNARSLHAGNDCIKTAELDFQSRRFAPC